MIWDKKSPFHPNTPQGPESPCCGSQLSAIWNELLAITIIPRIQQRKARK